jgi:hypothetical protein
VRTRFGSTALRFWKKIQSHPIGNRLKAIDFIGGFELHGTKKPQNTRISRVFVEFLWADCEKNGKIFT